jgi:hypothetical protein
MQKTLILIALCMLASLPLSAQNWEAERIDDWFEVSYPAAPEQVDTFDQRLLYLEQDSVVFFASKASGETPNVTDRHKLAEYYDGLVNGFIDQTGARLLDETEFRIGPLSGRQIRIEFSYNAPSSSFGPLRDTASSLQTDFRQVRFLLLNEHTYVMQYWYKAPESEAKVQLGTQFFESFKPLQEITQNMQFSEVEPIEKGLKPWIGETVLYVGLVLLIAFVYMLGRYVARSGRI